MPYDESAAARVRSALPAGAGIVETRMMGALVFMVDGSMCCGVTGRSLMVRVGASDYAEALERPHVKPLEMSGRRPRGFVCVDPEGFAEDAALAAWLERGLAVVAALSPAGASPPSPAARRRRRTTP